MTGDEYIAKKTAEPLNDEQLAALVGQVGTAAATGLPLEVTLRALAEEESNRRLADVALELAAQLERGQTIEQAMATLGNRVPAELAGLLRAGVQCGNLATLCESFARQQAAYRHTARVIRFVMAYPLLIFCILLPFALLFSQFVLPMFDAIFQDFNLELPALTEMVLEVGRLIPVALIVLPLVILGVAAAARILGGRWLWHRVRAAMPLLGRLWSWAGQREFAATLASFLECRVPLAEGVSLTGDVLHDRSLARACAEVSQKSRTGRPLTHCLSDSIDFDRSLVALVAWGEQHGLLPEALRLASEVFEDRIEQFGTLLRRLIPPATLVVVATLLLFGIIGLFLPLVKLIEGLSG